MERKRAETAYDIGTHAANEALGAIMRICEAAGPSVSVAAVLTAFAIMQTRIKVTAQAMDLIIPNFTESMNKAAAIVEAEQGEKFMEFAKAEQKRRGL